MLVSSHFRLIHVYMFEYHLCLLKFAQKTPVVQKQI